VSPSELETESKIKRRQEISQSEALRVKYRNIVLFLAQNIEITKFFKNKNCFI